MAANLSRLPNYTCRETIERTSAHPNSRHFSLIDRLRLEVAYVGGRELYAWPGEDTFEDRGLAEIVGGGAAIGTGSFALHARAVFTSKAPVFSWAGETEHDGKPLVRFNFQVTREKSRYAIRTGLEALVVAYGGYFEADPETLDPLLLDVQATGLPAELKLRNTSEAVHYERLHIGDDAFLLPISSDLMIMEASGAQSRNLTSFESCREYAGTSTVRFDIDDGSPSGSHAAGPIELPPRLQLVATVRDAIVHDKVARGDVVYANVLSDVKKSGHVVIPRGALLTGRITRVGTYTLRTSMYLVVGVRFHTIEFDGRRGGFSGELGAAGIGTDYAVGQDSKTGESFISVKTKNDRIPAGTRLVIYTR